MMDKFIYLILTTLIPWLELRGSIPLGISMGINPLAVFFICVSTNVLLVIPLFWFLDHAFFYIEQYEPIRKRIYAIHKKVRPYIMRWGPIGLLIFVSIPLPGSGAYTGAVAAYILGMPKRKAFNAIAAGVVIAGVIVTMVSMGVFELIL
ncbi:MAG: small multi-drug export protein [Candidatus Diapherotrites archaeon]|nr:small multi-drug export protein [Candidatus Diapherotrites archaeon]